MPPETHDSQQDTGQESQSPEKRKRAEKSDPYNAVEHIDDVPQRQSLCRLWLERSSYVPFSVTSCKPYFQFLLDLLLLLLTPEIILTILVWACTIGGVLVASIVSSTY
ncbi:hypothetical protein BJY01DRAFT_252317 [Aspergillus pseudoustus]|uniref:Uncharacterized protein n=1 Tax=Aspergillus pseudoustus TaxID=1810923 RepID=A0ABR4J7A7_9EURO